MPSNRAGFKQWNVRLDPGLSAALDAHLRDPLLVGLPKGALQDFFTVAVRNELTRRGAPCDVTTSTSPTPTEPVTFF